MAPKPSWGVCNKCVEMDSAQENVCCGNIWWWTKYLSTECESIVLPQITGDRSILVKLMASVFMQNLEKKILKL